jgi:hypothetical protein
MSLFTVLMAGCLSLNPTLERVGYYRQFAQVEMPIEAERDISDYPCYIGVPFHLKRLVGKHVYFNSQGPFLVTDVESVNHKGYMLEKGLIDTDCTRLVHSCGQLMIRRQLRNLQ